MKKLRGMFLGILVILFALNFTGCVIDTSYQKGIYDNNNEIIKSADSYSYVMSSGKTIGNKTETKFQSFSGMDTIKEFKSKGAGDITIDFKAEIDKGDFKVVLITPDNQVITIVEGTNEGTKKITIMDGSSRLKFVGRETEGRIQLTINVDENIKIHNRD